MSQKKSVPLSSRFVVLSILGAILSSYLVYHHAAVNGGFLMGPSVCNINSSFDCDAVAKSAYSMLFGLPVASFGLFFYLGVLLFVLVLKLKKVSGESNPSVASALLIISILGLLPSLYFLYVSSVYIQKWCLFCALVYLTNFLLFAVAFIEFRKTKERASLADGVSLIFSSLFSSGLRSALFIVGLSIAAPVSFSLPTIFTQYVLKKDPSAVEIRKLYSAWESKPEVVIDIRQAGSDEQWNPATDDYVIGSPDAEITIVEFSDFECPFCQRAAKILKPYAKANPDTVRLVFKNYPLDALCNPALGRPPHQLACQGAVMARCAGLNSKAKFWEMHDALFELEHSEWTSERLATLPESIGLDSKQTATCVSDGAQLERVREDVQLGNAINVQYTPSIFINGRLATFQRLTQLPSLVEMIRANRR